MDHSLYTFLTQHESMFRSLVLFYPTELQAVLITSKRCCIESKNFEFQGTRFWIKRNFFCCWQFEICVDSLTQFWCLMKPQMFLFWLMKQWLFLYCHPELISVRILFISFPYLLHGMSVDLVSEFSKTKWRPIFWEPPWWIEVTMESPSQFVPTKVSSSQQMGNGFPAFCASPVG